MLKKIISLTISLIIIITGLILTDTSLPFLSNYLGYDLHGNGLMGITFASMILVLPGLFIFSWLALVLSPFITNALFNYAERMTALSAAGARRCGQRHSAAGNADAAAQAHRVA